MHCRLTMRYETNKKRVENCIFQLTANLFVIMHIYSLIVWIFTAATATKKIVAYNRTVNRAYRLTCVRWQTEKKRARGELCLIICGTEKKNSTSTTTTRCNLVLSLSLSHSLRVSAYKILKLRAYLSTQMTQCTDLLWRQKKTMVDTNRWYKNGIKRFVICIQSYESLE